MVRLLPLLGAAALLCQSVIAAPTYVRRGNQDSYSYDEGSHDVSRNREDSNRHDADRYDEDRRYDNEGYDQYGYNRDGYDRRGYNRDGYNNRGYNDSGYDRDGYDERGYNEGGYNRDGYDERGYNENGYDRNGYDEEGYNEEGYNYEGYNREGNYNEQYRNDEYQSEYRGEYEYESTETERETQTYENEQEYETTSAEYEYETTSVEEQEQSETSTSEYAYPTYGSGSSEWGNNLDECVAQCQARFGEGPRENQQNNDNQENPPSEGTGAVHTILVAPDGAGLKYMPFSVNASVGDIVRYVWSTPADHTATLSSALQICNKSALAEDRNFVSGVKNGADGQQTFDVTVETTEPQFFYCSVAQHCQKGMFGIINPAQDFGTNNVASQLTQWVQSNPDLQAMYNYVSDSVSGTSAEDWGSTFSLDGIPEEAYPQLAANIMFTRANFAANPGMIETGLGATNADGSPVTIVSDLNTLLSNSNFDPNASDAPNGTPTGPAPSATDFSAGYGNGAISKGASVWVAGLIGIAGWLLI